ncbi:hypothetical protein C2S53_003652 [Perilla frutescens var. hirtella]|uniref:Cupin type-1 domain-containing protein n=1 Tax=Perilla frutescens var. hirtella TaxID=608512 RepID=A0AAD4JJS5_PERFH|nr:hypothetical protein C2S53_003652 [Perilla frutescens var. hirtella]
MEFHLLPQKADTTVFEGEGGAYYAWTAAKTPVVSEVAIGAGKLVLQPRGFALPHCADTYKIGYVVQGCCTVGLVLPNNPEERVVIITDGDAIPLSVDTISWWFNGGDSDVTIMLIGESRNSYTPGLFDYFFLTGAVGILNGFSTEFISKIYHLSAAQSEELVKSQPNPVIAKIDAAIYMPNKPNCKKEEYVISIVGGLGFVNSPLLDKIGLSPSLVRVEPETVLDPSYGMEHRIIYVTKGEGRIQIVGLNGTPALDGSVEEGQLVVVPKFFAVALLAAHNGLEFFCVSTSSRPSLVQIAGKTSAYKAMSSSVLQASVNVSPEFVKIFKSKL